MADAKVDAPPSAIDGGAKADEKGVRKLGADRKLPFSKGAALMLLIIAIAVFGPFVAPYGINDQDLGNRLQAPMWMENGSPAHVLGTDPLGRDILSRLIAGTRNSITISGLAALVALTFGGGIGLIVGYRGGWIEAALMRVADVQQAFPSLVLAIALAVFFKPGIPTLVLILAIGGWVTYARVVRGTVLSLKTSDYVLAARTIGATPVRIVVKHLLPNVVPLMLALATFQLAGFIIAEASLSFLGLGLQPPLASWGGMLADGRPYLATRIWLCAIPGTAIMITVLAANFFGDTVRVWLDPRSESAG